MLFIMLAGLSEDSDYTSDMSYPNQQYPQYVSYHQANSSSSQFDSMVRQFKSSQSSSSPIPASLTNQDVQSQQSIVSNNFDHDSTTTVTDQCTKPKPKRELPFGGCTDLRNIRAMTIQQNNGILTPGSVTIGTNNNNKLCTMNHEENNDPLCYNSRPRRALPQINFNRER